MSGKVLVEKIENGYITVAETVRANRTVYHSTIKGVVAELNKAFGTQRLTKDQLGFLTQMRTKGPTTHGRSEAKG